VKLPALKQLLRRYFGDSVTSQIHAIRYVWRIRKNTFGEADALLVGEVLAPGDIAIDVGANGADWTKVLCDIVGTSGHVFAFEADPYYAKVTSNTIRLLRLRSVSFFGFGLSNASQNLHLKVVLDGGVRTSGLGYVVEGNEAGTVPIALRTLDSLVDEYPLLRNVNLIKCDVEGHELAVFQGCEIALANRPIVVAEVFHAAKSHDTSSELFNFFESRNYKSYVVNDKASGLIACSATDVFDRELRPNRWFIPAEKEASIAILNR
jgi:FkbM family methyltransferase